jgi:hypothetical protein
MIPLFNMILKNLLQCSWCLLAEDIIFRIMSHLEKNGAKYWLMSALDIFYYENNLFLIKLNKWKTRQETVQTIKANLNSNLKS